MIISKLHKLCAAIAITVLATSALSAANFVVNTTADGGPGSLRGAILDANANGGGNIVFPNFTGALHLTAPLPTITANINILGPGTNLLTVSGNSQYSMFSAAAGTTNLFANFVIADGYALGHSTSVGQGIGWISFPGCAISNAGSMTILNCTFSNCINRSAGGQMGGGTIYSDGVLAMKNCLFVSCGSTGYNSGVVGGCVYNGNSLTMDNCVMRDCRATSGHAVANGGTAVLNHCQLINLSADDKEGNGGAINGWNLTLNSCIVSNCWAGWEGGAIIGGNVIASNTIFANTSSGFEGGAFYVGGTNFFVGCTISNSLTGNYGGGAMKNFGISTFVNCVLSGNAVAYSQAGAIFNLSTVNMTNCTVSGNSCISSSGGGGAFLNASNATLNLTACTVVSNNPNHGPGGGILNQSGGTVNAANTIIANNTSNDFTGVLISGGNNLIRNITNCTFAGNLTGNITNADPLLGPLQNNGGTTATHALLVGSPAIDAGFTNGGPGFDQRGVPRPQGAADDIGAFEFGADPLPVLLAVGPTGNGCVCIDFTGVPGRSYTILRSSSPAGPWNPLIVSAPGSNACGSCLDINPPAGSAFYKIASQ